MWAWMRNPGGTGYSIRPKKIYVRRSVTFDEMWMEDRREARELAEARKEYRSFLPIEEGDEERAPAATDRTGDAEADELVRQTIEEHQSELEQDALRNSPWALQSHCKNTVGP